VSKPHRARFVALTSLLPRLQPDVDADAIRAGRVLVDGRFVTNPAARVRQDAAIRILPIRTLRGTVKLAFALDTLEVPTHGRIAVDIGANAGGFTTALLDHGARRVYAVDAGTGQLRGSLRVDGRVVNLEGHNVGDLDSALVPDVVDVIVIDLSYLSVAGAVPQLERLRISRGADLVALIKPTFELNRSTLAASDADLGLAVRLASEALKENGWSVVGSCPAPHSGQRGAREVFVHTRRM
jgi:23S rRNA (cytidine1920-2'-O)/16S rRNA (cytidine1409-2'-O)-methyltransferase